METKAEKVWLVISATGNTPRYQRGLTLLEILLVVLIIGLLSTVAVLTLPTDNSQRELRQMAERMTAFFRYARQEAVFTGTTHGVLWREGEPQLVKRSVEGWEILVDDRLVNLQQAASRHPMFLKQSKQLLDLSQDYETPQIVFTNDGQVSPFTLIIRGPEGLEVSLDDSLSLAPEEQ